MTARGWSLETDQRAGVRGRQTERLAADGGGSFALLEHAAGELQPACQKAKAAKARARAGRRPSEVA
jgi:hypothetical protein